MAEAGARIPSHVNDRNWTFPGGILVPEADRLRITNGRHPGHMGAPTFERFDNSDERPLFGRTADALRPRDRRLLAPLIAVIPFLWSISLMSENHAYNALMHEVCVGFGWCGAVVNGEPSHVDDLIPAVGPVSAEQFVDWLFQAEGIDPQSEPAKRQKHKASLREAFVRHMRADLVDASALKWDVG